MSCADVMYQPYSPYFPVYQRTASSTSASAVSALTSTVQAPSDYRKFCASRSVESPLDQSNTSIPTECRLPCSSRVCVGTPECTEKEKAGAQYLSANCVVFTYYSGDISSVVDEHFSRALSQAASYSSQSQDSSSIKDTSGKDGPPMSHRNFPPSFWNSNYQPSPNTNFGAVSSSLSAITGASHADLTYGAESYPHPSSLHATFHHHQNDPWHHHYTFTGQSGHFGHHRPPHDLSSYHPGMSAVPGTSRFNPQYGSLLLQPSVRSARLGSSTACSGLEKTTDSWGTARYHDPISHMDSSYPNPYSGMTAMPGLEGQAQDSKDLYWF